MDILLVDDNLLMQQVLERFLGSLGYRVTLAGRADEAMERAREVPPALILMDLHLPDRDGVDTLRMIRELPACRETPAIAMSGLDEQEARSIISADFSTFITKPVDLDVLEQIVRQYLTVSQTPSIGSVQ